MAFTTVIDKNQLESAMTATADVIRSKTGDSNPITWDPTKGFSDAIESINTGITPSGSMDITSNGTYDVANYANASVNVPNNIVVRNITIASDLGVSAAMTTNLLKSDAFVKTHYADEEFTAILVCLDVATESASESGVVRYIYGGNRALIKTSNNYYGFIFRSVGESSYAGVQGNVTKISGTGWNASLRAKSTGDVDLYTASGFVVKAGNYRLIMFCAGGV